MWRFEVAASNFFGMQFGDLRASVLILNVFG